MDSHYTGTQAYFRSKFALAAFTFDLSEELAGGDITVNCVHPASPMNTHMVRESLVPPMSTVGAGVKAVMNLAAEPAGGAVTGRYFDGHRLGTAVPDDLPPVHGGTRVQAGDVGVRAGRADGRTPDGGRGRRRRRVPSPASYQASSPPPTLSPMIFLRPASRTPRPIRPCKRRRRRPR
jgi:hypothetical protein